MQCTLRDAIKAANTNMASNGCTTAGSGPDTIRFQLPNPSTITLGSALDQITEDVNIQGPGASQLTVSGASNYRVFDIASGKTVSISGLTVENGSVSTAGGCPGSGAGIRNEGGTLTLDGVVVTGNQATGTDSAMVACANGAGIYTYGVLVLRRSTVIDNHATATESGAGHLAAALGGGIFNDEQGTMTIDQSTVSGNDVHAVVTGGAAAQGHGAGIETDGTATVKNSTIAGNGLITAGGLGGGIYTQNGTTTLLNDTISQNIASAFAGDGGNIYNPGGGNVMAKNTIVAEALTSGNCGGTLPTSLGNDLGFESTGDTYPCFTTGNGNVFGDPTLGPLQANGGPTQTEALGAASAARDAGSGCEATDQRGLFRGGAAGPCDIGAFELGATMSPPSSGAGATTPTGQRAAALKKCKNKHGKKRKKCRKRAKTLPV